MRLLELFSGTGSVGNVAKNMGFEIISLDMDMEATIKTDIMKWDYTIYPRKHFDVIWASPPCTEYSRAKTIGVRKLEEANMVVQQTLDILEYFEPRFWLIENPQTGLLKDQLCMYGLPWKDIDYCKYGMPYRKRTRIWNNVFRWEPRPLCIRDCNSMDSTGKSHIETAQRGPNLKAGSLDNNRHMQSELYRIPEELVQELFAAIVQGLN